MRLPDTRLDVVVVGAGPAGLLAAIRAAAAGAWVLLLEAKPAVGARCHCAEWVPALLAREAPLPAEVRRQRLDALECRAGELRAVARLGGMVIHRPAWERLLARQALWLGVSLALGWRFQGFDQAGRLIAAEPGGHLRPIRAGAVVAADGALSPTAAALGLVRQPTVAAVNLELAAGPAPQRAVVAFRPDLLGYAWCFPKGQAVNLGLGGRPLGPLPLAAMLGQWRAEAAAEGLAGHQVLRRGGGRLPVAGLRQSFHRPSGGPPVLLCGDAAGLTHPCTGAGIGQAVASGQLAGAAAAALAGGDATAGPAYQAALEARFGGFLARGVAARGRAEALWPNHWPQAARVFWPPWPNDGGHGR